MQVLGAFLSKFFLFGIILGLFGQTPKTVIQYVKGRFYLSRGGIGVGEKNISFKVQKDMIWTTPMHPATDKIFLFGRKVTAFF